MATHQDTLIIERTFNATPERVFAAFTSLETKAIWFRGPDAWRETERTLDLRVGGAETMKGDFNDGFTTSYTAVYFDIVPNERLIYSFDVVLQGNLFSVSLATHELNSTDDGTVMTFTEQITYIDNEDPVQAHEKRREGTQIHFDRLEKFFEPGMIAEDRLSLVFGALADPIRRAIVSRLTQGPATVGELAKPHAVSGAAISKHLRVLEGAGLLVQERQGQFRPCRLQADALRDAKTWLTDREAFWQSHFDRLEAYLADEVNPSAL